MKIRAAEKTDSEIVSEITHNTIHRIYPRYYPAGAVDFFIKHHDKEKIIKDIENKNVYLIQYNGNIIGTVTINGNEINRLFVLPEYHGKGYGRELLDFAEDCIFSEYKNITLSASLPAKNIYISRGYKFVSANSILTDNGDYLCYDIMEKTKHPKEVN